MSVFLDEKGRCELFAPKSGLGGWQVGKRS